MVRLSLIGYTRKSIGDYLDKELGYAKHAAELVEVFLFDKANIVIGGMALSSFSLKSEGVVNWATLSEQEAKVNHWQWQMPPEFGTGIRYFARKCFPSRNGYCSSFATMVRRLSEKHKEITFSQKVEL